MELVQSVELLTKSVEILSKGIEDVTKRLSEWEMNGLRLGKETKETNEVRREQNASIAKEDGKEKKVSIWYQQYWLQAGHSSIFHLESFVYADCSRGAGEWWEGRDTSVASG